MGITTTIYPGYDKFIENLSEYVEKFLTGEVLAFRGAHCSAGEHLKVMQALGDKLNWWPNTEMSGPRGFNDPFYKETHHQNMDKDTRADKNSLMLGWHLEHVGYATEQYVGAAWSMDLFECDPDAGKTMFVDVEKIFSNMEQDDQEFLSRCVVQLVPREAPSADEKHMARNENEIYAFVQPHWYLGVPVPRPVLNGSHITELISIEERQPSSEEKDRFNFLFDYLVSEITENVDNRATHSWEQGDLLLLDVFKVAHAITGGFSEDQRTLKGIFGINTVE